MSAHRLALERAPAIGFGRYIISATTPFTRDDLAGLRSDAPAVVERRFPDYGAAYARRGWRMFGGIERVYVNERAREELGWSPRWDFRHALDRLEAGEEPRSELALGGRRGVPPPAGPYPACGIERTRSRPWPAPASWPISDKPVSTIGPALMIPKATRDPTPSTLAASGALAPASAALLGGNGVVRRAFRGALPALPSMR